MLLSGGKQGYDSSKKDGYRVVYLPNCGVSFKTLLQDLISALLVAFGDPDSASIRQRISQLTSKTQLSNFCAAQPAQSLIFVLDQFNGVQEDSTSAGSFRGSKEEMARDFLEQVPINIFHSLSLSLSPSPAAPLIVF